MDHEKRNSIFIVIACVSVLGLLFCFGCMLMGDVNLSIDCFAVDSTERVYVGLDSKICVYEEQQLLYTIREFKGLGDITVKASIFTITPDDTLKMATGGYVIFMDLDGNVQEIQLDNADSSVFTQMESKKNKFVSSDGDVYTKRHALGRTFIQKNDGEIVYQISVFSFVVKLLLIVSILGFVVSVPAILVYELRDRWSGYF